MSMNNFCSNERHARPTLGCGDIRPMSLEERRSLLEREMWINNVVRILNMEKWEAENLWVRIQVENHNESISK